MWTIIWNFQNVDLIFSFRIDHLRDQCVVSNSILVAQLILEVTEKPQNAELDESTS